jgi:hypothetical protein
VRNNSLVRGASIKEARPFIEQWHYSHKVPTGKNFFFAMESGEQADLFSAETYAIACYGHSASQSMHTGLARMTGLDVTIDNMLELRRLCRREPKDGKPLTWFLSRCHKLLKKQGIKYIVSFSDPYHDHNGGIYKAANFEYLGKTQAAVHNKNEKGEVIHRRIPYHHKRKMKYPDGVGMEMARRDLGLEKFTTPPKDRWFIEIR